VSRKSHWYLIDFKWRQGNWRYVTELKRRHNSGSDCNGNVAALERLSASDARRTLSQTGTRRDRTVPALRRSQNLEGTRYGQGIFPEARLGSMTTTILRTLHYPLPRKPLQQRCKTIMTPILQAGLPYSGIARTYALVYGPIEYQGLGIPNLYTVKGFPIRTDSEIQPHRRRHHRAQLIRASEQLKLEIGAMDPYPYRMQIFPS
jgi:hypothetical protein